MNNKNKNQNIKVYSNHAREYNSNQNQICLLNIIKGQVIAQKCLFSFKMLTKAVEFNTICIILLKENKLLLERCEIIGHNHYTSLGMLV